MTIKIQTHVAITIIVNDDDDCYYDYYHDDLDYYYMCGVSPAYHFHGDHFLPLLHLDVPHRSVLAI